MEFSYTISRAERARLSVCLCVERSESGGGLLANRFRSLGSRQGGKCFILICIVALIGHSKPVPKTVPRTLLRELVAVLLVFYLIFIAVLLLFCLYYQ